MPNIVVGNLYAEIVENLLKVMKMNWRGRQRACLVLALLVACGLVLWNVWKLVVNKGTFTRTLCDILRQASRHALPCSAL